MTTAVSLPRIRTDWVDVAKAVAISLVVVGHVWRGLYAARLIENEVLFSTVDASIYLFHMPVFFFLSGLFVEASVRSARPGSAIGKRLESLIYPLVVWSYITAAFLTAAGSITNRPAIDLYQAITYPFPPKDIYWFLGVLFLYQVAGIGFCRLKTAPLLTLLAASLCLSFASFHLGLPIFLRQTIENFPYFLTAVIGRRHASLSIDARLGCAGLLAFLVSLLIVISSGGLLPKPLLYSLSFPACIGFVLAVAWLTQSAPKGMAATLAEVGRASIAIYLSHVIFTAGTRIVLLKAGVHELAPHLLIETGVGILAPLALFYLARRFGLAGLLGFAPFTRRRAARSAPPAPQS